MKLAITAFALCIVLATSSALADDNLRPDGSWWAEMSNVAQLAAVIGTISGYREAYAAGQLSIPRQKNQGLPREPDFPHTYSYYAEAVTDFYTLHPDLKWMSLGVVLECLSDQPPSHSEVACPR
jgi:hypothetical protein